MALRAADQHECDGLGELPPALRAVGLRCSWEVAPKQPRSPSHDTPFLYSPKMSDVASVDRKATGASTFSSIPLSREPVLYRLLAVEVTETLSDGTPLNGPKFETGDSHARGETTQLAGATRGLS